MAFESLDGGRTVFATFQLDRTADGLKMRNLRSDGRLTGAGVRISRTLSILHHLDLMVLTFGLILLPVILYPRWACIPTNLPMPTITAPQLGRFGVKKIDPFDVDFQIAQLLLGASPHK